MKKHASALRKMAVFLVCAGGGAFVGAWAGKLIKQGGAAGQSPDGWFLLLIPVLLLLVIAFHEFGHVAGGWTSGFQLWLYVVGPLRVERDRDRIVVRFNRDLALAGGLAAMVPDPARLLDPSALPPRMLRFVAGGPLASLLLSLLLLPAILVPHLPPNLLFSLLLTGLASLAITLATLLPHRTGGFVSDGARVLQLLRGGDSARLWCAASAAGSFATAFRPRDWPASLIPGLRGSGEPFDEAAARWLLHSWHMDREEWDLAETAISEALQRAGHLSPSIRPLIHASAALHYARCGHPETARAHLEQTSASTFLKPADRDAIEAAVLAAEARSAEALQLAARAEARFAGRADIQALLYREIIEDVRRRAA